jgi:hypothetical protein
MMVFIAYSISTTLALDISNGSLISYTDMEFAPVNAFRANSTCISFSFGSRLTFHHMLLSTDSFLDAGYALFILVDILSMYLILHM